VDGEGEIFWGEEKGEVEKAGSKTGVGDMEGAAKSEGDYEKIGESEEMIPGGMDRATP
jgi:hypothetical protein